MRLREHPLVAAVLRWFPGAEIVDVRHNAVAPPAGDCAVCGPHPFPNIRDEGCLLDDCKCPRVPEAMP